MMKDLLRQDGISGHKRCLSISGNLGGPPEILEISVAREHIQVPVSTLWLEQCPTCFHQTEASTCKTMPSRSPPRNVPGRHACDVTVQGGAGETTCPDNITPGINKDKSQLLPVQTIQYLGFLVNSREMKIRLTDEKILQIKRNLVTGKGMMTREPNLTMETDASLMGWGAVYRGVRTGGLWSQLEGNHINYLELLAAMFAVKSFAKDRKDNHVHLRMDNRTAVSYVNHMGGHDLLR